jgi:hypothetical protein
MNLPTESVGFAPLVGAEGGEASDFAAPDFSVYQDMRWCANCAGEQVFVPVYEFASGRVGFCLGCGEERVLPFTRTNSEAA